jgi:arabinose-5-phosphate isomerase
MASEETLRRGREVLRIEAEAVLALADRLDADFVAAHDLLLKITEAGGRVVVTGMGKSGHIGNKIAATLASTGTPAFFMHPAEASHGDLGMITGADVVIAISYSGESDEILRIYPALKRRGSHIIAITGRPGSSMARDADVHINAMVEKEACPLELAPTASSTATLALGDALAMALLSARGFTSDDFASHHPAGALGRRLLVHVRDVMRKDNDLPSVHETATLSEAVLEMSRKGIGMTAIRQHEMEVAAYALTSLTERFGDDITIHGPTNVEQRGATFSFAFRGIHPHDLSQVLDQRNVCVRAGHHCAKPLMRILGVNATARASFYLYNDTSEVDVLADALDSATDIFGF